MSGAPAPATLDVGTDVALAEAPYRGGRLRAAAARLLSQRVAFGALCILVLLHVVVFVGPLIWRVSPDSAASGRDYPLVMGITVIITLAVVIMNLIVDLVYSVIDARVRIT